MRKLISTAAVLALMSPAAALAQSQATGQFNVSMEVTGTPPPTQPTIQISELDDVTFGAVTQQDLLVGLTLASNSFCVIIDNPSVLTLAPKITIDQTNTAVFNADVGGNFALVGPARVGTTSGLAQVPFEVGFHIPGQAINNAARGVTTPAGLAVSFEQAENGCGTSPVTYPYGGGKPALTITRLPAADALNPAGIYFATVRVTVTPQ